MATGVGGDILLRLTAWAPWIWTGSSVVGIGILSVLWKRVNTARRRVAWQGLTDDDGFLRLLMFFERLVMTSFAFLGLLIFVGVGSRLWPKNAWVGLSIIIVLLVVPSFITYLSFRAIKLRVFER